MLGSFIKSSQSKIYCVLFTGVMMMMTFGTPFTFGNMNPYMTSYMRHNGIAPTLTYTKCSWVYAVTLISQGLAMPFAGLAERYLGYRLTSVVGCTILSGGVALSHFSIQHSFEALMLTYGVMFGAGAGIAYMIPITCALKWMTNNPGLATGIVNGGAGGGALIFTMIQTTFINPENKKVRLKVGEEIYFDQGDVLDNVPYVFFVLAGCYYTMQLLAILLLINPPSQKQATIEVVGDPNAEIKENGTEEVSYDLENDIKLPLIESNKRKPNYSGPSPDNYDTTQSPPHIPATNGLGQEHKQNEKDNNETTETDPTRTRVEAKNEEEEGMTPGEMLRTLDFYLLFFMFLFNGLGMVFLNTLYKAFGLTFINDDIFLSLVWTLSSVFNFIMRIVWGIISDKFSFRIAMMIMCTQFTALILTLQVTVYATRYLFMLYICLLIGTGAGTFTLIPTAIAKRFGKKHVTTNYGIAFLSQIISTPLTILISQSLLSILGWPGLFFVIAALSYGGFILALFFRSKDENGAEI